MSSDYIKILITGDFCPVHRTEKLALDNNYEKALNDFIDVFSDNDLNIIDLECPLTNEGSARQKIGPHQKAHPDCINFLKLAGINVVALANNHMMDYDTPGARDTVELCKRNQILHVGIGSNGAEAANPISISIRGKRIAILNYADNEFLKATDSSWQCNPIDPVRMFNEIHKCRNEHDFIIAIIHAGNEHYELPSPRIKGLYRYVIDIGADAVVSHHTHAYSGYEIYKSKPIFYGLGNFIYDWPGKINGRWNSGFVVKLLLGDEIVFKIIPLKQSNKQPGVYHLSKDEEDVFVKNIERLNKIIENDEQLEAEYNNYCTSVFPRFDAFIEPALGKYITFLRKRGLFPRLVSGNKRLLLLNLIRCESHREILIRMLSLHQELPKNQHRE